MGFITYLAIYFIMWWVTLFLVLPFTGRSQAEAGEVVLGTVKSAPAELKFGRIIIINSIVASVMFAIFYIVVEVFGISFEDIFVFLPIIWITPNIWITGNFCMTGASNKKARLKALP